MGGAGILEWKGRVDADAELTVAHPVEHLLRAPQQFRTVGDVMIESRAGEIERAFAVQDLRVERGHESENLRAINVRRSRRWYPVKS